MTTRLASTDKPSFLSREWLQIVILLAPAGLIAVFWNRIPDPLPSHWGFDGQINGWMGKGTSLILLSGINLFLVGLFYAFSFAGDTPEQNAVLSRHLRTVRLGVTAFISLMTLIIFASGTLPELSIDSFIPVSIFLLFGFLGYAIRNVPPNGFVGVRIPKTLNNPENWKQTHRLTGKAMMIAAAACVPAAILLPMSWSIGLVLLYAIGLIVFPTVTSSRIAKQGE